MISYPRTFVREREYEHSHGGDSVSSTDFLSMLADTPAWSTVHLCGLSGSNTSVCPPRPFKRNQAGKSLVARQMLQDSDRIHSEWPECGSMSHAP